MRVEQDPITGEDKCALTSVEEIEAAMRVVTILQTFSKLGEEAILRIKEDYVEIVGATERLPDISQPALVSGDTGYLVSEVLKPETPILLGIGNATSKLALALDEC